MIGQPLSWVNSLFCSCTLVFGTLNYSIKSQSSKVEVWNQARCYNACVNSTAMVYARLQWLHSYVGGHEQSCYSCNQMQWGVTSLPLPYCSIMQFVCGSYQRPLLQFLWYSFQHQYHFTDHPVTDPHILSRIQIQKSHIHTEQLSYSYKLPPE